VPSGGGRGAARARPPPDDVKEPEGQLALPVLWL
jgi:hypothetical protein